MTILKSATVLQGCHYLYFY